MELYQSNITGKGQRDCEERWNIIKNEIPKNGVVFDVGSAEGYFCKKIIDNTNCLCISNELNDMRINIQKDWINDKYKDSILLCKKQLDVETVKLISKTCDFFECGLLLSVIHWIDNPTEFMKYFSKICGKIIIEMPETTDKNAHGQKNIKEIGHDQEKWLKKCTGRNVRFLTKVKAHTSEYRNIWIIEGNLNKNPEIPHVIYPKKNNNKYELNWINNNVELYINNNKQNWDSGINAETLKLLKICCPERQYWINKCILEVDKVKQYSQKEITDLRLHNVIVCNKYIKLIDLFHTSNSKENTNTLFEDLKTFSQ